MHVDKDNNLVPYFYFIQDSVTTFFVEELIPDPICIERDKNNPICYKAMGGNVSEIYWKAENGIVLETNGKMAKIILLPGVVPKKIVVSGRYSNGIYFRKESIFR